MAGEHEVIRFYENLLTTDYRDHVCDSMLTWNGLNYFKKGADFFDDDLALSLAKTVETTLIQPADAWYGEEYKKIRGQSPDDETACRLFESRIDITAVREFRVCADEVRYKVEHSRCLWPEYVEMLRDAWTTMLAEFSHSLQYVMPLAKQAAPFIEQRQKGRSPSRARKYIETLNDSFPKLSARELWRKLLLSLGDENENCPFEKEDDKPWDNDAIWDNDAKGDRGEGGFRKFRWFEKLLSEIRNPEPKKSRKSTNRKSR